MSFAGVLVDEADGIVWFGSDGAPGSVVSLDPSTKRFSPGIPVGTTLSRIGPGCDPVWLTLGGNYLWVTNADDRSLSVIATVSRQGVGIVALGGKPSGLAFGDDQVWAAVDLP
jgi:YVTN family beta-propeller protein